MPKGIQAGERCNAFEAALRKDLATAPVISYEPMLGGWLKRSFDIAFTLLLVPIWLTVMAAAMCWAKTRTSGRVFQSRESMGYAGRTFKCFSLRLASPTVVVLDAANDHTVLTTRRTALRQAIECLPRLINVLLGDMSLVGPAPLSREQLEALKVGKRYYMSARPGVVGIDGIVGAGEESASQYKIYALSWSVLTDALIVSDSLGKLLEAPGDA